MVTIALVPGAAALDGCVDRVHGRHPADVVERCQRAPMLRMGNVRPIEAGRERQVSAWPVRVCLRERQHSYRAISSPV